MDIVNKLKKELLKQAFTEEQKQTERLNECKHIASIYAQTENAIAVLSDMKANISYIYLRRSSRETGTGRTKYRQDHSVDMGRRNIQPHSSGRLTGEAFAGTPLLPLPEKCPGKETPGLLPYTQYAHARSFGQVCTHLAQDVLYSEPLKRKCMVILMPLQLFNGYVVKLHHS